MQALELCCSGVKVTLAVVEEGEEMDETVGVLGVNVNGMGRAGS